MSLKIRLARAGSKKRPYYHLVILARDAVVSGCGGPGDRGAGSGTGALPPGGEPAGSGRQRTGTEGGE